jgi:hypothetical protein
MSTDPSPAPPGPPGPDETVDRRFSLLNGYWEALQQGQQINPESWSGAPPAAEELADLRVIATLHDAVQMVRDDSDLRPPPGPGEEPATRAPSAPPGEAGEVPEVIGGYRLLRRLGEGGMGEVYEGEDEATGQCVAVKLIASHFAATEEGVERFRREGRLASMIAHPRCVFVLAADEENGRPYIAMERMPGSTLKDLVEQQGPLAPEQAVAKILDVIDGLREAHRLQVLHRDVKPSNCFLEADGRVKVGDFGLSKSLAGDAALTAVGTLLGTVHYASPEQLKDITAIDVRTDVYSVAATLYYLLTGRPPFASSNPAAVIAQKASEPPPSLRSLRPDIPPALERVVLRGLERDRDRRWRDLDELRQALLPFLPGRLSVGGMGLRVGTVLIDFGLVMLVWSVATTLLLPLTGAAFSSETADGWLSVLGLAVYFGSLEGFWGCSLGKCLLRLRVWTGRAGEVPGPAKVLLRTLIFLAVWLPWLVVDRTAEAGVWLIVLWPAFAILGILLTVSTMRARDGYRGPHELLSGTRVVQLPWPEPRPSFPAFPPGPAVAALPRREALPDRVGPFEVRGAISETAGEQVLLAEDCALKRKVWVRLRTLSESPADAVRREVRRPTRLRWLGGGRHGDRQWNAFLAPTGCPLADLCTPSKPLPWREVRPILQQLADELAAAERDGTLPAALTVAQVWVQPDGRVQLLDHPLGPSPPGAAGPGQALSLLGQVAVLTLEGRPRRPEQAGAVRAPLPLHASRLLSRLLGVGGLLETVDQIQAELTATRPRPVEVNPDWRAAHLAVLSALLLVGLLLMFLFARFSSVISLMTLEEEILRADALLHVLDDAALRRDFLAAMGGENDAAARRNLVRRKLEMDKQKWATQAPLVRYTVGLLLGGVDEEGGAVLREQPALVERVSGEEFQVAVTRQGPGGGRAVYDLTDLQLALRLPGASQNVPAGGFNRVTVWLVVAFPALWVLWAFLFRGGFSVRLMGIFLVRSSGRKALRLQCAWRALLVWAPVTALLLASAWLDCLSWSGRAMDGPAWWLAWLAFASWWLALALLVVYFLLAFRSPTRSLADRLASTYLVPG